MMPDVARVVYRLRRLGWAAEAIARAHPRIPLEDIRRAMAPAPLRADRPAPPDPGRAIRGNLAWAVRRRHRAGDAPEAIAEEFRLEAAAVRAFLAGRPSPVPPASEPRRRGPEPRPWGYSRGDAYRDEPAIAPTIMPCASDVPPARAEAPAMPAPSGDWGPLHGRRSGAFADARAGADDQVVLPELPAIAAAEGPGPDQVERWEQPKWARGRRAPAEWKDG